MPKLLTASPADTTRFTKAENLGRLSLPCGFSDVAPWLEL